MTFGEMVSSTIKAVTGVVAFLVALGWSAFVAVNLMVKAEGKAIKEEVMTIRGIDMKHVDKRFDKIESLIKENR